MPAIDRGTTIAAAASALGVFGLIALHLPPVIETEVDRSSGAPESILWQAAREREELDPELARLSEIGYVAGHEVAGELVGVSSHDPARAHAGHNLYAPEPR